MADVQWIKIFVDMFDTSRKIKRIEKMKNGDAIIVIWFKLLCMAGAINDGGAIYVTKDIPYTLEDLADNLRKKESIVQSALDTFVEHGMIYKDDAGFIVIKNWEKYQNIEGLEKVREQNRLRQKAWYDRQKTNADITLPNAKPNVRTNADITLPNAIEEEGEEEKEKEFHSFNHSCAREENNEKEFSTDLSTREELKRKYLGGKLGGGVVLLSDAQFDDLLDKLSLEEFNHYVAVVRDCELQGKPYQKKTQYQAILDMAMKDRKTK